MTKKGMEDRRMRRKSFVRIQERTAEGIKAGAEGKTGKRAGIRIGKKRALAFLLASALTAGLLGGCGDGGQKPGSGGEQAPAVEEEGGADGQTDISEEKAEQTAMGRYVEHVTDISEYTVLSEGITCLADGSLVLLDEKAGRLVSTDCGETWKQEDIPGIPDFDAFIKDNYIFDMKAASDGTVAVAFTPNSEGTGEFHTGLIVGKPDGEAQVMEDIELPEGNFIPRIWFSPEGRLFAAISGTGNLYEVDMESAALRKYMSADQSPDLVQFQGDYMILLTSAEGISFYNMKEEKLVEDAVLADFMEQNYMGEYYANETFTVYMIPGEADVIYVAGKGGVYRHVIGGSAMEQIIDGSLSSFSNPSMAIVGMTALGDDEFLVLFTGGSLIRYTYDPNVPTVPEDLVTVYSLEEEDAVRQAIAQFQTQNPQMYVRYEVGMSGSDGAGREDAVKKLNTELMAGTGPDVLILDGLPADSYIGKGVLKDLSGHVEGMTGEQALWPNIVESFREDGGIYRLPVSIAIPMMTGREKDVLAVTDMDSLADTVEKLRRENPGKEIIGIFSEEAAVKWFLPVAAAAFRSEAGGLDEQILADYLEKVNRIYSASLEGVPESTLDMYSYRRDLYQEGTDSSASSYYLKNFDSLAMGLSDIAMGDRVFMAGRLNNFYGYQEAVSLNRREGYEDLVTIPLDGYDSGVFIPHVMVGINASSPHMQEAEAFFDVMMGKEVQHLLYEGFAVNRAASEEQLSPEWAVLGSMRADYGEACGSVGGSYGDGREYSMDIYIPTREEYQALQDIISKVHTPYIPDSVVEEAVVDSGVQYLRGHMSLEEAVDNIRSKVEIYIAE